MSTWRLCIALAFVSSGLGCKPRTADTDLNTLALGKQNVQMVVTDGLVYVSANNIIYGEQDNVALASRDLSQSEALRIVPTIFKREQEKIKNGAPLSFGDTPGHIQVRNSAISQAYFLAYTISISESMAEGVFSGTSNAELSGLEIAQNLEPFTRPRYSDSEIKRDPRLQKRQYDIVFLPIKYKLTMTGLVPENLDMSKPIQAKGYVPTSDNQVNLFNTFERFRECIKPVGGAIVTPDTFFRYLDVSHPKFAELNENGKYLRTVAMTITATSKGTDGAKPEYKRIWEDDRLVATYIFGRYDPETNPGVLDYGTRAYQQFLKDLRASNTITIQRDEKISDFNVRVRGKARAGNFKGTRLVDIQVVHVDEIGALGQKEFDALFGNRLGPSDLFMYNGHSGYGNNIKHIETMVKPNPAQYVIVYLNGCDTYGYSSMSKNSNLDVISNGQMTDFFDMPKASIATLEGLIRGDTYKQILQKIPQRGCPVVQGEDTPSVK